jgi:hypothetical protein
LTANIILLISATLFCMLLLPPWQSLMLGCGRCLTKMTPQDLANTISALPELKALPDQAWLDAFCTAAAAKMPQAPPLALYGILFGLAKVKQAQRKAAAKAVKRRAKQQQQQLEETAAGEVQADSGSASGDEQQSALSSASTAAAAKMQVSPASPAQVKLLQAALRWLQRMQQQLTQRQLAGVIMSLGELLPHEVLHQLQSGQGSDSAQMQQLLPTAAAAEQLPADAQHEGSSTTSIDLKQQNEARLLAALQELVEGWRPVVEDGQLAAVLPKQQARLLSVAWQRLKAVNSSGLSGKHCVKAAEIAQSDHGIS